MAVLTDQKEITALRRSGQIAAEALAAAIQAAKPGVSTLALNDIAEQAIRQRGGTPSFLGFDGFPASLCVSINHEVVHGLPTADRKISAGDIVGLDIGVVYDGIFSDHARTIAVGNISTAARQLLNDTEQALMDGISRASVGATTGDIGAAIEASLKKGTYGIIRQLCGHGVGKAVHEAPQIPNYGKPGSGTTLKAGMVLAIEPMVTVGGWEVQTAADGWTVVTADGSLAAHAEHTVLVTDAGPEIMTAL